MKLVAKVTVTLAIAGTFLLFYLNSFITCKTTKGQDDAYCAGYATGAALVYTATLITLPFTMPFYAAQVWSGMVMRAVADR